MYKSLPADYSDRQTARCRISPAAFMKHGFKVGQWITLVESTLGDHGGGPLRRAFCRVWPARFDCKASILVDPYITSNSWSTHKPDTEFSIEPIPQPITHAQSLKVVVKQIVRDPNIVDQAQTAYEAATDSMRRNMVHDTLENLVLDKGFEVSNESASLLIKIVECVPGGSPCMVVKGTMISILKEAQEDTSASISSGKVDRVHDRDNSKGNDMTSMISGSSINILPGLESPIRALLEVVSYPLLFPEHIRRLNIECPKGILLHGPPGVGKTLLVSTVAHICKATMITIYGPEIFGPYVGESEEKLRQKFEQASKIAMADTKTPVIVFIDELDALTPNRNDAQAHESRVVAQLLTLMDGVASRGRVVVVAATNRPNSIDPALRRPGRFDREIRMEVPREMDRLKIIQGLIKDMPHILTDQELGMLARMTNGFVGADLEALCRESALKAVHRRAVVNPGMEDSDGASTLFRVTMADFKQAFSTNAPSLQRGYGVVVEPVRWTDIGGLESVKMQLRQAVEWPVLHKDTFARLGLKAPRGILLYGPPGCSKTTLVKAIATNSGASFLSVNGAALYSSYVGDSEKTIRETFHQARLSAPSIVFFDEIDTIVGKRNFSAGGSGSGGGGGDSVQERVLSTMLNEMDGVENAAGVLIVAATNRVDLIDKALLRPGRFDRVVYVPHPDEEARRQILTIYTRDIPLAADVDLDSIAQKTDLYTGADLQNVCREAAMIALRTRILGAATTVENDAELKSRESVTADDFAEALLSVKASLTNAMISEYSGTGTRAF
ncbi:hypothetical protein BGZ94_008721 [Podila epigama]|nr:hypothetical protein BGZ94_008721 [Podila epigama]